MPTNATVAVGTASGTLLSVSMLPTTASMVSTGILALIGAVVGFFASLFLKWAWEKMFPKDITGKKFKK